MTTHNTTNYDALLKDVYIQDKVLEQSYGENVAFAFMKKERGNEAGGRRYVQPVEFGNPGGASAVYGTAMTNNSVSRYEDFLINRQRQYQRVQVAHELWFATERRSDAYMKALDEFDKGFRSLGEKIGRRMYRTQGGSSGQLSIASTNTTTLSFTDNAAVFNFQLDQVLQFSTTDGTGTLLDSGDTTVVTAIDHEAGTVTIADNLGVKITGVTTSSFVFPADDYNACLSGFEDWLPVDNRATRLAATFQGVIRSPAPVYLGGLFMNATAFGGLDEVFIKLAGKLGKFGGKPDYVFANNESLSDLELISNSKIKILQPVYTGVKSEETGKILVGFNGYKILVGGKPVMVYPDRNCQSNRLYMLQLDTWTLWHTGDLINWLGEAYTGQRIRPSFDSDNAESQFGAYMNIGCKAPGRNAVAQINPST